jgi:hypothetical protein
MTDYMEFPRIGQLVTADGLSGAFFIVRVDESQGIVNLELKTAPYFIKWNIPLSAIHLLDTGDLFCLG